MKGKHIITATSKGIVAPGKDGNMHLQKYANTYESKSQNKSKRVQETADKLHLNLLQRSMYRRLMYGLKEYTPEQIANMSPVSISKVVSDYQKAARALHIMKAKVHYKNETKLVRAIFPHAKIGEKDFDWLMELPKSATLKKLGISTKEVVDEFIKRRLLPNNFHNLTPDNITL
jgi:hypothetical protein